PAVAELRVDELVGARPDDAVDVVAPRGLQRLHRADRPVVERAVQRRIEAERAQAALQVRDVGALRSSLQRVLQIDPDDGLPIALALRLERRDQALAPTRVPAAGLLRGDELLGALAHHTID